MKPLTDMTPEELLNIIDAGYSGYYDESKRKMEVTLHADARTELLRRLAAPVISPEPKCPKCGSVKNPYVECGSCEYETRNIYSFFPLPSPGQGWVSVKVVNELAELVLRLQVQQQKWLTPGGRNAMKPAFVLAETLLPAPPKEG